MAGLYGVGGASVGNSKFYMRIYGDILQDLLMNSRTRVSITSVSGSAYLSLFESLS